jgi:hypothetical protein
MNILHQIRMYSYRRRQNRHFKSLIGSSRLILSAGMPRSGSTLLFNVIRLILESAHGKTGIAHCWVEDLDKPVESDISLIKMHTPSASHYILSEAAFYSYRDIRTALVSYQKKFNMQITKQLIDSWIEHFYLANREKALMFSYESLQGIDEALIARVADRLRSQVIERDILEQIPQPGSHRGEGYSTATLLHSKHSTHTTAEEWKTYLEPSNIDYLHTKHAKWFRDAGYIIE